jgi:hypothetical protein
MDNDNTQVQASPAEVGQDLPEEKKEEIAPEAPASSDNDAPAYKIGGVFMLTILSFALFLNLFVVGIAILTMPK